MFRKNKKNSSEFLYMVFFQIGFQDITNTVMLRGSCFPMALMFEMLVFVHILCVCKVDFSLELIFCQAMEDCSE